MTDFSDPWDMVTEKLDNLSRIILYFVLWLIAEIVEQKKTDYPIY